MDHRVSEHVTTEAGYSGTTAAKVVGITYRQLDYWARTSLVRPSLADANFSKPDVTAPGVDILAGQTPAVANGLKGETFQYMSGTSQSAPETAGVAALLKKHGVDVVQGWARILDGKSVAVELAGGLFVQVIRCLSLAYNAAP